MSERQQIRNPKSNFTVLPNMYDDANLTVYEFRLLVHYKRVGNCYEATRTTARKCHVSLGSVVKARQGLAEKGWIKLSDNELGTVSIELVDRWSADTPTSGGTVSKRSSGERERSSGARKRSPGDLKEDSVKKTPTKKKEKAPAVLLMKRILHRNPHRSLERTIDHRVGRDFGSLLRWGRVLRLWKLSGWNVVNIEGMLDLFANGKPVESYDAAADASSYKTRKGAKK
jgi:hypothetical protein